MFNLVTGTKFQPVRSTLLAMGAPPRALTRTILLLATMD